MKDGKLNDAEFLAYIQQCTAETLLSPSTFATACADEEKRSERLQLVKELAKDYEQLQETILFSIDSDGQPHKEGTTWKRDKDYIQESGSGNAKATREECKEAILTTLAEHEMKMDVKELDELLQAMGHSLHAIKAAKAELKSTSAVKFSSSGFGKEKKWIIERTEFSEPESYSLLNDE